MESKTKDPDSENIPADVPPWAVAFFAKLKAEICAETTAKIAYTTRLMLDEVKEEIRNLTHPEPETRVCICGAPLGGGCGCKELQHVVKCLKKSKAACHAQRKEEKKQAKMEYKAARKERKKVKPHLKLSSTEGETEEFDAIDSSAVSNKTASYHLSHQPVQYEPVKLLSHASIPSTPPPSSPCDLIQNQSGLPRDSKKVEASNPLKPEMTKIESTKQSSLQQVIKAEEQALIEVKHPDLLSSPSPKLIDFDCSSHASVSSVAEVKKSPDLLGLKCEMAGLSDSEFEVVSLPPNIKPVGVYSQEAREESSIVSDYDDDSDGTSEAETEPICDEPCLTESYVRASFKEDGSELSTHEEFQRMSFSMSSNSTTISNAVEFMSTCSNDENNLSRDAAVEAAALPEERGRSPYSVPTEEVKKINQDVKNEQLPAEFHRDRNPYSGVVYPDVSNPQSTPQPPSQTPPPQHPTSATHQPQFHSPPTSPPPRNRSEAGSRSSDPYRVDVLPESLWEEAMTVAAKGYNAAKTVVGNLGTFVDPFAPNGGPPTPSRNPPTPQRPTSFHTSVNAASGRSSVNPPGLPMSPAERQLLEMGFTNRSLNATLLARHRNDLGKVISELLDH